MIVSELIEILKEQNQDAEVFIGLQETVYDIDRIVHPTIDWDYGIQTKDIVLVSDE